MGTIASSRSLLVELDALLHQLSDEEFSIPRPVILGSSIGGHVRHILEFYEELLSSLKQGCFSYDDRKRNALIESEVIAARTTLARCLGLLEGLDTDMELEMRSDLPGSGYSVQRTTLGRELAYLADHGVHHMAIVRIALEQALPHIAFQAHLGVAVATMNHRAG